MNFNSWENDIRLLYLHKYNRKIDINQCGPRTSHLLTGIENINHNKFEMKKSDGFKIMNKFKL